jgi:phytoene dehydrogenase-like protein
LVYLDQPDSGVMAYSILAGRQRRSWTMPEGGSGRLTDALVAKIRSLGGIVITNKKVHHFLVEGGRCNGFETEDGDRYLAREAVVSTVHVKHLLDMAPGFEWDAAFRYGIETFDPGIPSFVVYLCTSEPPRFKTARNPQSAVSSGIVGWPEEIIRVSRQIRDGEAVSDTPWILVATPTLADSSRAPGGHHTVKLAAPCSITPPRGTNWSAEKEEFAKLLLQKLEEAAPNMTPKTILATLIRSPEDVEAANPHMINGTFHGGDRGFAFSGDLRPAPGWAQHRTPLPGLYQTGGTTHPGGSITGAPGRNAARIILQDLGTSLEAVVASSKDCR